MRRSVNRTWIPISVQKIRSLHTTHPKLFGRLLGVYILCLKEWVLWSTTQGSQSLFWNKSRARRWPSSRWPGSQSYSLLTLEMIIGICPTGLQSKKNKFISGKICFQCHLISAMPNETTYPFRIPKNQSSLKPAAKNISAKI